MQAIQSYIMQVQGSLIIISAPSGAGKTSLVTELIRKVPHVRKSISHTTRKPRAGEKDGEHYHFISKEQFASMLQKNIFLEHAEVFGNFYGTSRDWVTTTLQKGDDVVLEIDWQGAQQIRSKINDAVSIFVLPPNEEALLERLKARNLDDSGVIAHRMQQAKNEVSHYNEYDYLIVNDDFSLALQDLIILISAARLRSSRQKQARQKLLAQFCQ